ncbi:dienelactone hydrolase family protein [Rhizobium halophilum]|uniref:dienelactone hydrolase family protein n=1 Tax=Rhizobium halophilum TaxID=2846852 RepID=UPI001EFED99C|nr:dienelactone hydrolase family protein [Rhizobium halophilum]MCF6370675.1 dienelactone hydrolase family protein [Rhizobium halophilum]
MIGSISESTGLRQPPIRPREDQKIEQIVLPSRNPVLLSDLLEDRDNLGYQVEAELYLPKRCNDPAPGVVVSEGLGGLQDSRERGYGRRLAAEGYVVLVIDSFTSRGVGRNGDLIRSYTVTEAMMLADAFAGLAYLSAHPDVDQGRIGIVGFSYGGMVSVLTSYSQIAELFLPAGPRFATHVSYYGCTIPRLEDPTTTGAPVTMFLGEQDRNVSIPRAQKIAADSSDGLGGRPHRVSTSHVYRGEAPIQSAASICNRSSLPERLRAHG